MCTSARAAWCEERDASGVELPRAHQDPTFQQLYRQGNEAFKQKRWSDAELLYLKAWALVRSFDIAANLGEVQLQLKKPRSAAAFLAFGLRTAPPSAKPEQIARMRHFLDEAKAQVGTLRVRVKNVADAEVFVDGERMADAEVKHEVYLEPGPHVLVLRRAGYEEQVVRLMAGPGVTETITQELKPKAEKAPEAAGPGATGSGAAGAPVQGDVKPTAPAAGVTKAPAAGARVEEQRSWVPVIALGAASAVGLGVGVGFTVAANNASADADKLRAAVLRDGPGCLHAPGALVGRCEDIERSGSRAEDFGNGAILAYAASGTFVLAALAIAIWPRSPAGATGVRASTSLHAGGASLSIEGTW
ncbi:hypothetical protein [Sorangium sp. So ce1151]|uniref:hypothetical protein n=1 Tax=Sorangium sp. So ce1151 TaxID=3133332 RepID=UPI003F600019